MMPKAKLTQDPHGKSKPREKVLEVAIGKALRDARRQQGLTIAELARDAGLSTGMLSKIETGATSPSLTTLQSLSRALRIPITTFFQGFEERREAVHTPAGQAVEVERRATRSGHQYNLLGHLASHTGGLVMEPYMITLSAETDQFPTFQHDGIELLYMLDGTVDYRHGERVFRLLPGDTLLFEADAPHGPETYIDLPARFLSIIAYPTTE